MKRSIWKLPFIHSVFFKKRFLKNIIKNNLILRNSLIPAIFIGQRIKIYNGTWFLSNIVSKDMLGFKLGQFSITKLSDRQALIKKKNRKKSKKHKNK